MFSKTVRDGCSFPSWIKEVLIQEFIKHKDEIEPDKHREMGRKGGGQGQSGITFTNDFTVHCWLYM